MLGGLSNKIPASFEFRTFWLFGQCVGIGRYWYELDYQFTKAEEQAALNIAQQAASLLKVPFLVIDVAQTQAGNWIVIECNDAQESGYAGISPYLLWENIITIFKKNIQY